MFAYGEESAALAFARLAGTQAEAATRDTLAVIAGGEAMHETLPEPDPGLRRTPIRFYGGLRYHDAGQHLERDEL